MTKFAAQEKSLVNYYFTTCIAFALALLVTACGGGGGSNDSFNPELTFSTAYQVNEGESTTITFTLEQTSFHDVSFNLTTVDGTATNALDYSSVSSSHSIESGESTSSITIDTLLRAGDQESREFYLEISDINGATINTNRITVEIIGTDNTTSTGFVETQTQASYQAGNLSISLTKSTQSDEEVTLPFEVSGTATEGEDYNLITTDYQVVFAANSTTASIDLNIIDNGLPRSGSTINFLLQAVDDSDSDESDLLHSIVLAGNYALNDTGALTSDDALYGRDSDNEFNDNNDGEAGFSFTKIDYQGNKLEQNASSFSCVLDNVTGLTYERKQTSGVYYGTAYNAKLNDDEISLLGMPLNTVTYQDIYDNFANDFSNITSLEWEDLTGMNKTTTAFKPITSITTDDEISFMLSGSQRESGLDLTYPYNLAQEELHYNWRSNQHIYYWLNEDENTNGGRTGTVAELENTRYPVSQFCAFPHEEMISYLDDIEGCNSADYLLAMNDLAVCGHSDWRLPTVEELRAIVNYETTTPTWDAKFMPNNNSNISYMSASPSVNNDASIWCVAGDSGEVELCHKQLPNGIRAVRGDN